MSITKHKIISVPITEEDVPILEVKALQEIDKFLANPNFVYEGHSICIMTKAYRQYGSTLFRNEILLISIIYKDLAGSSVDLKAASPQVKKIVQKAASAGEVLPEPDIISEFEQSIGDSDAK